MKKMYYGGDYNPEQWPKETWTEDMRLLKEAEIDMVTINVFNWASLQKDEESYDFSQLDEVIQTVTEHGMSICLATSTGAHPAWMARKYPDILRTEFNGMKRKFGGRHNSCPNSPTYRRYAPALAKMLAKRYQGQQNLAAWHVSNEFGGECYCENCEKAFRDWLKNRYQTMEELNRCWNTAFWGHTFYDWEEIVAPNMLSEHFEYDRTMFQGISLDYRRFQSESMLECYRLEYDVLKAITPEIPVTTNLMGSYKPLNYKEWAKYMDFVSWDNYPSNDDTYAEIAFNHDLMRGIKGGAPFFLMEQTPSVTNWLPYNALKRPGVMRLWSYQAVAHGADSVMFFQMRRSVGACEKLHGAVIDHVGTNQTRVFKEIRELGEELVRIGSETLGGRTKAQAALYFDWENWWAIEYSAGPSRELSYKTEVMKYYQGLLKNNISIDIVGPEDDLEGYRLLIAPVLYMIQDGYAQKLEAFVESGGTFVTTFFSGMVDSHDLILPGGYPGSLRKLLGIWVEESDALPLEAENHFVYQAKKYPAKLICDLSHLEGAESLAAYEEDFYAGMPVITRNHYGKGRAYYVGTSSDSQFFVEFLETVCQEVQISSVLPAIEDLEVTVRENENGSYVFLLNHGTSQSALASKWNCRDLLTGITYQKGIQIAIDGRDVMILKLEP